MTIPYEVIRAECQLKRMTGVPDRSIGRVQGMQKVRRSNCIFEVEAEARYAEFEDTDAAEIVAATGKTAKNAGIPA